MGPLISVKQFTTERILYYTGKPQNSVNTKVRHKWTGWSKSNNVVSLSHICCDSSMEQPPNIIDTPDRDSQSKYNVPSCIDERQSDSQSGRAGFLLKLKQLGVKQLSTEFHVSPTKSVLTSTSANTSRRLQANAHPPPLIGSEDTSVVLIWLPSRWKLKSILTTLVQIVLEEDISKGIPDQAQEYRENWPAVKRNWWRIDDEIPLKVKKSLTSKNLCWYPATINVEFFPVFVWFCLSQEQRCSTWCGYRLPSKPTWHPSDQRWSTQIQMKKKLSWRRAICSSCLQDHDWPIRRSFDILPCLLRCSSQSGSTYWTLKGKRERIGRILQCTPTAVKKSTPFTRW